MRSADGRHNMIVRASPIIEKSQRGGARLVFRCYGEACFLSQLLGVGDGAGLQLPRNRTERALERARRRIAREMPKDEAAGRGAGPQSVAVLLRQR